MTPDKTTQKIAQRVRQLRNDRGWTQENLAQKASMKRSALNMKEQCARKFNADEIIRISDAFGITAEELVRGVHPEQLDIHEAIGLSSEAIRSLQDFRTRSPENMDALNTILSSPHILHLIASYMTLPAEYGTFRPPEKVTQREDGMYEMKLTPASLRFILESAIIRAMRELFEKE